jgi:hypothetical protein
MEPGRLVRSNVTALIISPRVLATRLTVVALTLWPRMASSVSSTLRVESPEHEAGEHHPIDLRLPPGIGT